MNTRRINEAIAALHGGGNNRHVVKEPGDTPADGGIPMEMLQERTEDDWGLWKVVPSKISRADVEATFGEYGVVPPEECIAYYLADCHLVDQVAAYGGAGAFIIPIPSDDPLGPLREYLAAWASLMALGYVPLGEYGDGYGPICLKQSTGTVVWFDHERLHPMPELKASALGAIEQPLHVSVAEYYAEVLGMKQTS
ncbi:MAG: hypothetical protein ACFCBW_22295 [Candidatus Competibacterales bacterium]